MKTLNEDIRSGNFKKVYLLYGNESFLIRSYRKKLYDAASGGDTMNSLTLSGKEAADLPRLREFTDTMPFFADRRVLLLCDTGLFHTSSENYDRWLSSLPDTAVVIFAEQEVDKRNKLFKLVTTGGHAAELSHPEEKQLRAWVLSIVKNYGLNITVDACNLLTSLISEDMESGKNEMDKLCAYCLEKGAIGKEDVEAVCCVQLQNRVFDLVSRTSSGDREGALKLYYDLLALREPPLRILFLISREIDRIYAVSEMLRERRSRDEIAEILGLKPFIAGKLMDSARRFRTASLRTQVEKALDFEKAVKTGDLADTMAVELLILSFSEAALKASSGRV